MVWVYVQTSKQYWKGPFEISKRAWTKRKKVCVNGQLTLKKNLFLFSKSPISQRPRTISTERLHEIYAKQEYSVEEITQFRTRKGKAEVKVKWTGYPGQDSWEPLENMIHIDMWIKNTEKDGMAKLLLAAGV